MKTKILVTGSSGFIGQHLVNELSNRSDFVVGVDIKPPNKTSLNYKFVCCDIRDANLLKKVIIENKPEIILHLAAKIDLDGYDLDYYSANIDGVQNLIEAIKDCPSVRRCIYTSSQLVCEIGYVPQSELDYKPSTLYGESKVLTEQIVRNENGGGVEWSIVRPTTIWGPAMSPHYQRFFLSIWQGWYFHVGKKPLYKSYGYVGNTIHQYIKLMEADVEKIHRKTFYLADYEPISLRSWANEFQKEMGAKYIWTIPEPFAKILAKIGDLIHNAGIRNIPFTSFRLKNVLTEYQFDLTSTQAVCGQLPFSISDGVKHTTAWLVNIGVIKK